MGLSFKGTQGKWKCSEVMNFSDTLVSYINSDKKSIAQLRGCKTGEEKEAYANARLIASAPELYEIVLDRWKNMNGLKEQGRLNDNGLKEHKRIKDLIDYILSV